jgi:hypothetical protein
VRLGEFLLVKVEKLMVKSVEEGKLVSEVNLCGAYRFEEAGF